MIRIMLDTYTLIAGMVFGGNERKLLHDIYLNKAILIVNEYVVLETKAILKQRFPGFEKLFDDLLQLLQVEATPMPSQESVEEAREIIRDPKDAIALAAAMAAKPDLFVSGDLDFHTSDVKLLINVMHVKEAIALVNYQR